MDVSDQCLFLTMPSVCLHCVMVAFPCHTHLLLVFFMIMFTISNNYFLHCIICNSHSEWAAILFEPYREKFCRWGFLFPYFFMYNEELSSQELYGPQREKTCLQRRIDQPSHPYTDQRLCCIKSRLDMRKK